jgi:hypothetical protein
LEGHAANLLGAVGAPGQHCAEDEAREPNPADRRSLPVTIVPAKLRKLGGRLRTSKGKP